MAIVSFCSAALPVLAAALALAPGSRAQVRPGDYVASVAPGALVVFDRSGGAQPISGIPLSLRTPSPSLAIRNVDGVVWMGETRRAASAPVQLHEILIRGSVATVLRSHRIGTADGSGLGSIQQIAATRDGGVVFTVDALDGGAPLGSARIAKLAADGTLTPLLGPSVGDFVPTGLAVTPDERHVVVAFSPLQGRSSSLYEVALDGSGHRSIGITGYLTGLAFRGDGTLFGCTPDHLVTVDTATGRLTSQTALAATLSGIAFERATGRLLVAQNQFLPPASGALLRRELDGSTFALATLPGQPILHLAVRDNPFEHGPPSGPLPAHRWQVAPAPGGLPLPGNAGFALQVTRAGAPVLPGVLVASLSPADLRLGGLTILLDPGSAFAAGPIGSSGRVPFPIPASATPGIEVWFQSFHPDPNGPSGFSATPAQSLTVMR